MAVLKYLLDLGVAFGLDRLSAAWVDATFIFGLLTLIWSCQQLRKIRVELEEFEKILSSTDVVRRSPKCVQQVSHLLDQANLPSVKRAWQTYLLDADRALREGEPLPDFGPYFSEDHLIGVPARRAVWTTVPGLLVAFGILGTFVGLVIGLGRLDLNLQDIRPGIQILVGGMGVAFYSSLAGISTSIAWTVVDRIFLRRTYAAWLRTHDALRIVLPVADEAHLLGQLVTSVRDQTLTIKSLAEETIIPELVTGLGQVAESFRQAVEEALEPHVRRSQEAVQRLVDAATQSQLDRIKQMADAFVTQLDTTMQGRLSELATVLAEVLEWQTLVKQEVSDLIGEIRDLAQNHMQSLEAVREASGDVLQAAQSLGDSAKGLTAISESIAESQSALANTCQQMLDVTNHFSRAVTSIIDSLNLSLQRLKEITGEFDSVWIKISDDIERIQRGLDQGTQTFVNNLHSGLDYTFSAFDEQLGKAIGHLASGTAGLSDVVTDLTNKLESLRTILAEGIRELNGTVMAIRADGAEHVGAGSSGES